VELVIEDPGKGEVQFPRTGLEPLGETQHRPLIGLIQGSDARQCFALGRDDRSCMNCKLDCVQHHLVHGLTYRDRYGLLTGKRECVEIGGETHLITFGTHCFGKLIRHGFKQRSVILSIGHNDSSG
jgi:hypothetical protein